MPDWLSELYEFILPPTLYIPIVLHPDQLHLFCQKRRNLIFFIFLNYESKYHHYKKQKRLPFLITPRLYLTGVFLGFPTFCMYIQTYLYLPAYLSRYTPLFTQFGSYSIYCSAICSFHLLYSRQLSTWIYVETQVIFLKNYCIRNIPSQVIWTIIYLTGLERPSST